MGSEGVLGALADERCMPHFGLTAINGAGVIGYLYYPAKWQPVKGKRPRGVRRGDFTAGPLGVRPRSGVRSAVC